jgi:hypothetical protein
MSALFAARFIDSPNWLVKVGLMLSSYVFWAAIIWGVAYIYFASSNESEKGMIFIFPFLISISAAPVVIIALLIWIAAPFAQRGGRDG